MTITNQTPSREHRYADGWHAGEKRVGFNNLGLVIMWTHCEMLSSFQMTDMRERGEAYRPQHPGHYVASIMLHELRQLECVVLGYHDHAAGRPPRIDVGETSCEH